MSKTETTPVQVQLNEGQVSISTPEDSEPKPTSKCPSWCTLPEGHGYDMLVDSSDVSRCHDGIDYKFALDDWDEDQPDGTRDRPPASAQVSMLENWDGTTATYRRPYVSLWGLREGDDLTADDCVRLSIALGKAVYDLRRITA